MRAIIFRCKSIENGKILNPLPGEIMPFQKWIDEVEFCSKELEFRTLEFVFYDEEKVYFVSTATIDSEKWTFSPIYLERRTVLMRVGVISPTAKPELILAAVLYMIV